MQQRMTSRLLSVALLAAAAPAAQAQSSSVTLTGTVDAYAGSRQISGAQRSSVLNSNGMNSSRLIFEGQENLGNSLFAKFHLGSFFRPDIGSVGRFDGDPFWGQAAWVGLDSRRYGNLHLGRVEAPDFVAFIRTNAFGSSAAFGPAFLHNYSAAIGQNPKFLSPMGATGRPLTAPMAIADGSWNNGISYTTPSFLGGLTLNVTQGFGESADVGDRTGISLFYAHGPLNLSATVERAGRNNMPSITPATAVARQSSMVFTAAYDFGVARVSAGMLQTHHDYATIADDMFRTYYVSATAPLGRGTLMWETAVSRGTEAIDVSRQTTSVGYNYFLSKRLSVYGMFMYDKFKNMDSGISYGVGLQKRF